MRQDQDKSSIRERTEHAAAALMAGELTAAREGIAEAMAMDMDAPEPHNLLGIWYEMRGDYAAARRHYRAAYALDPTYTPCCRNLERIATYGFSPLSGAVDFGIEAEEHAAHGAKLGNLAEKIAG